MKMSKLTDPPIIHSRDATSPFLYECDKTDGCQYHTSISTGILHQLHVCDEDLVLVGQAEENESLRGQG